MPAGGRGEPGVDIAFTVHLPVDTGSVPFIRGLCRQALVHLHVQDAVIDEIALALTEACANVVQDRKSTRLNSSHANISYAVFCLKKKKTKQSDLQRTIVA